MTAVARNCCQTSTQIDYGRGRPRTKILEHSLPEIQGRLRMFDGMIHGRSCRMAAIAALALCMLVCCPQAQTRAAPAGAASTEPEEEPAEWLAKPEELATVPVNDIVKSIRLNGQAQKLGREVYDKNCASCHGADLKGSAEMHA